MRIVHLVIGGEVAGGQLVALQLARAAGARGDAVAFVSPEEGGFTRRVRDEGFDVHLHDLRRTFAVAALIRFTRFLRRTRTDVLHIHTQLAPQILGRVAGRLAGARVVSHIHIESYFRPNRLARLYHRTLDNASARLCHAIVAVSEDTRRALVAQGYPPHAVRVVHNGVELPPAAAAESRDATVAEIARLAPVKGQRELIAAIAQVPEARVVLAGKDLERGGAYRRELERFAAELGVGDRVEFSGFRPDTAAVIAEAAVVALPSASEGLPISVLEAMAHGRPVVATPVGGTPELVVDGETGLLVPPGDVGALANALRRLLSDRELARRMGAAGRRRVEERFSAQRMADAILELYE